MLTQSATINSAASFRELFKSARFHVPSEAHRALNAFLGDSDSAMVGHYNKQSQSGVSCLVGRAPDSGEISVIFDYISRRHDGGAPTFRLSPQTISSNQQMRTDTEYGQLFRPARTREMSSKEALESLAGLLKELACHPQLVDQFRAK